MIFQNYSQIVEVYGKEEANSIMGNCDTMVFLGGSDPDTLKIVCEKLGKETVRNLSYGISKGRSSSTSTNKQQVGRELMSRIQVEQMSNNDCLVFVRSLRPFKRRKYELSNHPNYKYLVETDEANAVPEYFQLHFDEEEMEAVRVKSVNEEGYIYPPIVDSPRRRAQERAKERKAAAEEKSKAQSRREASGYQICDETRSAQAYKRNVKAKDTFTGEDATEQLKSLNIEDLQLVDDFDPLYEF